MTTFPYTTSPPRRHSPRRRRWGAVAVVIGVVAAGLVVWSSAQAAPLVGAGVTLDTSDVAGATTGLTVSFTTVGAVPAGGYVSVTLPAEFTPPTYLDADPASGAGIDGNLTIEAPGGQSFNVRSDDAVLDTIDAGTPVTITVSGVVNPTAAGATGTFTIETRNPDDSPIDTAAAVAGVTVQPAAASKLRVVTQPAGAVAGAAFTTQPAVEITDQYDNRVIGDSATQVTAAIDTNPAGGALSGQPTVTAASGLATFTDLELDNAGAGYTLQFTSNPALTATASDPFNVLSTDADLSNLTLSAGTLTPAFASATVAYTADVSNAVATIDVTATTAGAGATIEVGGGAATSGVAESVPLFVGANAIDVVVTAQDGVTEKTYTVTVTRAASSNADLSDLELAVGGVPVALSPAFDAAQTVYVADVPHSAAAIDFTATAANAAATLLVGGIPTPSGTDRTFGLWVGENLFQVVVRAEDGVTMKVYTITVDRAASPNADLNWLVLSEGTLDPAFAAGTLAYTASVGNEVTSLDVTALVADAGASITIAGEPEASGVAATVPLAVGANVIEVVVTAADTVATRTYTVTVTRAPSSNADLSALAIDQGTLTPVFAGGTTAYTASVGNSIASLYVTATLADATATLAVEGVAAASGVARSVPLAVGANAIDITVTAQDGTTEQTYTVTVTRDAPPAGGGGGFIDDPAPVPSPTPRDGLVREDGDVSVPVTNRATVMLPDHGPLVVETRGTSGAGATVIVPAGAFDGAASGGDLPAGVRLEVAAVDDIDRVERQAPAPADAAMVTQFVVRLVDGAGNTVRANFAKPVTIEFNVPAEQVPAGADPASATLVFWNGSEWVQVEARVVAHADGSVTLTSDVLHFTLFGAVWPHAEWGTFSPRPATEGVTLTVWRGGSYERLASALREGDSVWTFVRGKPFGYRIGAPAFVNADFLGRFPDGIAADTLVITAR